MDLIITDEKILRTVSRATTKEEVLELDLKNRIKASLPTAWTKGFGLAAIQINVPLRYAWFWYRGKEFELINPEIIKKKGDQTIYREGCLSIPQKFVNTTRAQRIEYLNNGKKEKAKGIRAAIIQHEIDHMNGFLNTERVKVK